jgi:hypothetical protein
MQKLLALFIIFISIANTSKASFNASEEKETFYTTSPVFEGAITKMFSNLSRIELEKLTGRRLTLRERIAFALLKFNARHKQKQEQTSGFNLDGFLLGFVVTAVGGALLGLLGLLVFGLIGFLLVIATFIFSKDKNYQKWMLLGWLAGLVASYLVFILRLINSE